MSPNHHPTLGILGGHSALAGSFFHARLLDRLRRAGLLRDEQYPRIIHWSTPLEGLVDGWTSPKGTTSLTQALAALDAFSPSFVAVTCNSLTPLVDICRPSGASAQAAQTPVHAVNAVHVEGPVLVLAAGHARQAELVQPAASRVDYTTGADQAWVANLTQAVREQGAAAALLAELQRFIGKAQRSGYTQVVLACTELSALVPDSAVTKRTPYVDSMACLLDQAVAHWERTKS
jgi:aspartate/glutamate racemase